MNSLKCVYLMLFMCIGSVFCDAPLSNGPSISARSPALSELQYANEDESEPTYEIAQQGLENGAIDPNAQYVGGYADPVQQYVGGGIPYQGGALIPYQGAGYPFYGNPGGYAVQSGYEGYLVPSFPPPAPLPPPVPGPLLPPGPGPFDFIGELLPYPRTILSTVMRTGGWLMGGAGVMLFGGILTTAVCTLTPLCSITFPFAIPFLTLRETAKTLSNVIDLDADTADRVQRAADFVQVALEKYNKLQATTKEEHKEIVDNAAETN